MLEKLLQSQIDLLSCEMEPIHAPGHIQPQDMVMVLSDPELEIIQVTDNAPHFVYQTAEELLGQHIRFLLGAQHFFEFQEALRTKQLERIPTYLFDLPQGQNEQGLVLHVMAHRIDGVIVLEFEAKEQGREESYPELIHTLKNTLSKIRNAPDLSSFWQVTIEEVKQITGFDRVMVYEFDIEGNGAVIAETRQSHLEPYLHLHYPASDIPQRARQLYLKSLLRNIPDIHFQPVPLVPRLNPTTGRDLDLTYVASRGVSPIHIQYLQNMGVSGTMSISIITDNTLWGLIACHHYSPKHVPLGVRTLCSLLGQFVSLEYIARIQNQRHQYQIYLQEMESRFIELMVRTDSLSASLMDYEPNLSNFINASGAILYEGTSTASNASSFKCVGLTPPASQIPDLIHWLSTQISDAIYSTQELSQVYPPASAYKNAVSGILAISLVTEPISYIVWCRPEKIQTINWAGSPDNSKEVDKETKMLTPRASFELWKTVERNKSEPWTAYEHFMALEMRDVLTRLLLYKTRELNRKTLELERQVNEKTVALTKSSLELSQFAALAAHDLRIPLRKVALFSKFLLNQHPSELSAESLDYVERIQKSILKMQMLVDNLLDLSHATLKTSGYSSVDLLEVIISVKKDLKDLLESTKGRIEIEESITVNCNRMQIYQIMFNLIENALKFHKKNIPPLVQVSIQFAGSSTFEITVKDNGIGFDERELENILGTFERLPAMVDYEGVGIGLGIVKKIVDNLNGTIEVQSKIDIGSIFKVVLPVQ